MIARCDGFQFLIGSIKTIEAIQWNTPDKNGFQFLIGSIKTLNQSNLSALQ